MINIVRDMKRSSAILVPRTFRTPLSPRPQSPVYEEPEYERRVEFDMRRHTVKEGYGKDVSYRVGSPPGPWTRKENVREKERKEGGKEKERKEPSKERDVRRDTVKDREVKKEGMREVKKEGIRDVRKESVREVRKGQPPPTAVLHGYKYPIQQPKSILKRTESHPSPPFLSDSISFSFNLIIAPAEISFVRQARPPIDRHKGTLLNEVTEISDFCRRIMEQELERAEYQANSFKPHLTRPSIIPIKTQTS
jgi:hypothetical protein